MLATFRDEAADRTVDSRDEENTMVRILMLGTLLLALSTPASAAIQFLVDFQVTDTRSLAVPVADITPPSGSLFVDENALGLFQPNGQVDVESFDFAFGDLDVVSGLLTWTPADDIIIPFSGFSSILFDSAGVPTVAGNLIVRDLSPPSTSGFTDISIFSDGTWDIQPPVGQELIKGTYTISVSSVPEPSSTFLIWALGLVGSAWYGWRRRGR